MKAGLRVAAGSLIFAEGDRGESAYLVKSGRVEISVQRNGRKVVFTTIGPKQMFGEMALIDDAPRSATATALADSELLVITPAMLKTHFDKLEGFMKFYVEFLTDRVRDLSKRVTD